MKSLPSPAAKPAPAELPDRRVRCKPNPAGQIRPVATSHWISLALSRDARNAHAAIELADAAFAEEDSLEAVLLGPVGLDVPVAWVVSEVLGHGFVGVELYLAEVKVAGLVLGQGQQAGADTLALSGWQNSNVLQQQVAGLGDEDDEADDLTVLNCDPRLAAADSMCVIGRHRCRRPADSRHVAFVGRRRDHAEGGHIHVGGGTQGDHPSTVGQVL